MTRAAQAAARRWQASPALSELPTLLGVLERAPSAAPAHGAHVHGDGVTMPPAWRAAWRACVAGSPIRRRRSHARRNHPIRRRHHPRFGDGHSSDLGDGTIRPGGSTIRSSAGAPSDSATAPSGFGGSTIRLRRVHHPDSAGAPSDSAGPPSDSACAPSGSAGAPSDPAVHHPARRVHHPIRRVQHPIRRVHHPARPVHHPTPRVHHPIRRVHHRPTRPRPTAPRSARVARLPPSTRGAAVKLSKRQRILGPRRIVGWHPPPLAPRGRAGEGGPVSESGNPPPASHRPPQISRFFTFSALFSMNCRRGST